MGVKGQEEDDEQVVGVPEGFITLLPYPDVGGREHEKHAKHHDMARYATCLAVVDLSCRLWADLISLHVKETAYYQQLTNVAIAQNLLHIMRRDVDRRPE